MSIFFSKFGKNKIDTEINDFGELNSFNYKSKNIEIKYKKSKPWREIERSKYKITGIAQLGTTYPTPYDRETLIKIEYKPNIWYSYPLASFIITLVAIIIDTFCYLSMFDYGKNSSRMNDFYILFSTLGAAIAIDVLPIFLAHNIHRLADLKKNQKSKKLVLIIFSLVSSLLFIFVVGIVFKLRLHNISPSSDEFWKFILMSMIPISTSLLCFITSYLSYSPLKKQLVKLKFIKLSLEENINELNAMIAEYDSQPNYYKTLKDEDEALYEAALKFVDDVSNYYKAYVRMYIIPFLSSPAATSDLTSKKLFNCHNKINFPIYCDNYFEDLYGYKKLK